jgi:hypothetical protein
MELFFCSSATVSAGSNSLNVNAKSGPHERAPRSIIEKIFFAKCNTGKIIQKRGGGSQEGCEEVSGFSKFFPTSKLKQNLNSPPRPLKPDT